MKQIKYVIDEESSNQRLDLFLVEVLEISRASIKKQIMSGEILLNNQKVKAGMILKEFDEISLLALPKPQKEVDLTPVDVAYDVIYQDQYLQVINKPKGLVVHPAPGYHLPTLVHGLLYNNRHLSTINGEYRPGIVHRLDKDTDGLMIVANDNPSHQFLANQFSERTATRAYYVLVYGTFKEDTGTINAPVGRNPKNRLEQIVTSEGREAITNFKVIQRLKNFTLISCELLTGRTHQIRVHLNYINHPIVGDEIYGPKNNIHPDGQMLFSYKIGFIHPKEKEYTEFELDIPKYFTDFIATLT